MSSGYTIGRFYQFYYNLNESGYEYPKHRPDKHGYFGSPIGQIALYAYYIIFSTDTYRHDLENVTGNRVLTGSNPT